MTKFWPWVVFFCVSLGINAYTECTGDVNDPITLFEIGDEVYGPVLRDGGKVVGIDVEAGMITVQYKGIAKLRHHPTARWSVRCGCLGGFCVGDSVEHRLLTGSSVVWAINYSYKKLIVRTFFLNSFQDYYPEELRHIPYISPK